MRVDFQGEWLDSASKFGVDRQEKSATKACGICNGYISSDGLDFYGKPFSDP